ncbi:MAG: 50S ribosome-binding GTPase [Candidatus Diapherotrites archaeon]|nr:50S ribosome-binding GTPase [Candidatus Diapherotrites archaeon]
MPTNVTVDFERARDKSQKAKSAEEKLNALYEMQRFAPSHKGGENLRRDISRKIAQVKKEQEKQRKREKQKGSGPSLAVKKEGIGQIAIVGLPNSGKSWLLNKLTGVDVEIAPYPFTTKKPVVGMMNYKGAKIQLVELPALVEGSSSGKANGPQLLSVARTADAVIMAVRDSEEQRVLLRELRSANIAVNEKKPMIEVTPNKFGGIEIANKKNLKAPMRELISFLKVRGLYNVNVVLNEELRNMQQVDRALDDRIVYKNALLVNPFTEKNIESLPQKIFSLLGRVLIYTKRPGEKPDLEAPLALPKGATIEDAARMLHKDLAERLKFARVWGGSKFGGQRVARDYRLQNLDVVEIYC